MNDTPPVISPDLASIDQPLGDDSASIIRALATRLHDAGRISDIDVFTDAALAREALGSTVLPVGIAMPHARSAAVTTASVTAARLPEAVTWSSGTDPVRIVLLIAAAGDDPDGYLALLQKVATACVKTSFVNELGSAATPEQLANLVAGALGRR
ncbi:PTS sugar transporter subunit IIA [Nocardioides mangrovi]|uniref:PTS sugar transporter subunit IIA n=1 Tax=Nocardioides mangrovi TaxID=2874580 RepID=A0ABS7UES0_9ACTN|nr:PTS sugar transporter subunit IIA [Nocardioides mangrovi]MBZ5739191.1 PTS sugar transporter subunit IIA [Nocardioides mangrovi]